MRRLNIQTERLVLRPFERSDVSAFHGYMSDGDAMRYTSMLPISREQAQEIIDRIVEGQQETAALPTSFAIAQQSGGHLIGNCRLGRDRDGTGEADIAYFLDARFWGQGYATEAVRALIAYGFQRLGLRRVFGLCVPENMASRRVMEKAGMQAEEALTFYAEQGHFYRGEFRDITYLRYGIECPTDLERIARTSGSADGHATQIGGIVQ